MKKIVLLTGATGFVGRQILASLLTRSLSVRLVVRTGSQHLIEMNNQIESVVVSDDLFAEDLDWWEDVCRGVDTIIHAAWYTEPGIYLQSPKNIECLVGTLIMGRAAASAGVRRFFGVGTCFEYDLTSGYLSADTPLKPLTLYAATKAAAFMALQNHFLAVSVEFGWGRLFYLYGEGEDVRRFVPYVKSKLERGEYAELTNGNQIRDFMDVEDAGREIAELALGEMQGPTNVCSGVPVTVRQLAEKIGDEFGRRDLLKFGVRADNLLDPLCVVGMK